MQKLLLWVIIIAVVLGGAYWWMQSSSDSAMTEDDSMMEGDSMMQDDSMMEGGGAMMEDGVMEDGMMDDGGSDAPLSATVTYDGTSFSPSTVTIKQGGMVTWSNTGDGEMWVASAQHPTHTVYDGTNLQQHCPDNSGDVFDQCAGGEAFSFIFDKTGTWRYHDHLNANAFGSVVVVE